MNTNEIKYFNKKERQRADLTSIELSFLLKSLFVKLRRKTWGKFFDKNARLAWTADAVSDTSGPADNLRNYNERRTIRSILSEINKDRPIKTACEMGCGYGRLIMVLKEFAGKTVGFEREGHLVDIARKFLPDIEFCRVKSLDNISELRKGPFDFVMTCTVLQHLTDDFCRNVLEDIKRLSPDGHVLLIEKTEPISITENTENGNAFLSRNRSVQKYAEWMKPYKLIKTLERVVEPTYFNPSPGTCMLFRSSSS